MTKSRRVKLKASTLKKRVLNEDDYGVHVWTQHLIITEPKRQRFWHSLDRMDDDKLFDVLVVFSDSRTILSLQ